MNASYFGESLARVGADLRGLSVPLFSDFLVKKGTHELLQAEMNFSRNLHQFNLSTCLIQQRVEQLGLIGFEDPSAGGLLLLIFLSLFIHFLYMHLVMIMLYIPRSRTSVASERK